MGEIDPAYIQELEHRPKVEQVLDDEIPVIDLSILNSPIQDQDPEALESLAKEIGKACKEWGFFQVTNHGVPIERLVDLDTAARKFFLLPNEEKVKVRRSEKNPLGYYESELTKNVRDWKEVFDYGVQNPMPVPASHLPHDTAVTHYHNQWPEYPSELKDACEGYSQATEKLAIKLMELIALSLGLPRDRFHRYYYDQTSFVRINYYPPCPDPQLALGIGRHKDTGCIGIVYQDDAGGLEVRRKSDGEWVLVKPIHNALVVNVGDIIQVWTNDLYESVEHRVKLHSDKTRVSAPYFYYPAHDIMVEPLEELLNENNPPKYRGYNWGKFFVHRKLSNFKKLNVENIQTYHFKIVDSEEAKDKPVPIEVP